MARYRRRAGFSRQVRRKFVWNRAIGAAGIGTVGVDLLAPFRAQPGCISARPSCASGVTWSQATPSAPQVPAGNVG